MELSRVWQVQVCKSCCCTIDLIEGPQKSGTEGLVQNLQIPDMSAFEVLVTQSESWALDFLFAL